VQIIFALGALSAHFYVWLFIYGCGLGLTGAALALAAVNLSNALMMAAYIVWHNRKLAGTKESPWTGWQTPLPSSPAPSCHRGGGNNTLGRRIRRTSLPMQTPCTPSHCKRSWSKWY